MTHTPRPLPHRNGWRYNGRDRATRPELVPEFLDVELTADAEETS